MRKKLLIFFSLLTLLSPFSLAAGGQLVTFDNIAWVGLALHAIEILLALFISYMSLTFFRITRPVTLFFFLYVGVGFFIVSSLMYVLFYLTLGTGRELSVVSVYFASRIALIGMLISFLVLFYQWNKIMKRQFKA